MLHAKLLVGALAGRMGLAAVGAPMVAGKGYSGWMANSPLGRMISGNQKFRGECHQAVDRFFEEAAKVK